ncbi:LCP family protein [Jatrophihabitans fulvus]
MPEHAVDPSGGRAARPTRTVLHSIPVRLTARVVAALVSAALLVLAGYVWVSYRDLDAGVTRLPIAVGRPDGPGAPRDVDGNDQNILLVGNDDRSTMTNDEVRELKVGRDGGSLATDTMMIVHIPADGSRATLISLPRDTKIDLPGQGQVLLNAPYALAYSQTRGDRDARRTAGANALLASLKRLTGLTFDHYVQVDLLGFYRISNALDGVPVTMCAAVNDTVAYNRAHNEDGGSGLVLPKGRSVLDGAKALQFVRQRHGFPTGDLYRVKRQQYFLTAAFRRVASVGILFEIRRLKDALRRSVFVDDGLSNLLDLSGQLENLTADRIVGRTIPVALDGSNDPLRVKQFVTALTAPSRRPTTSPSTSRRPSPTRPTRSAPIDSGCIR